MRTIFDVRGLEKTIKACPGWGLRALSLTWRVATQPLFLHRISVVFVYLCIATTTPDPAGRDPCHLPIDK